MKSSSEDEYARALMQCYPQIHRYFSRRAGHDAEDLASETMLAAWRAREGFRGEANVATLAFRIAIRQLARYRRRQGRGFVPGDLEGITDDTQEDSPQSDQEAGDAAAQLSVVLQSAIKNLPESLSEVVHLFYVAGNTQWQIASQLGLPPGTVASRLRRAKQRLRLEITKVGLVAEGDSRQTSR